MEDLVQLRFAKLRELHRHMRDCTLDLEAAAWAADGPLTLVLQQQISGLADEIYAAFEDLRKHLPSA